jgi:hypothetical protein
MKTIHKKQKRNYTKPQIGSVKLDNEISVFMLSSPEPPVDPISLSTDHFSFDPYKLLKL